MPRKRRPIEHYVDENGCHICTSHPSGLTTINGKSVTVHNYIYRTKVGEIPEGMIVTRECGNKKCINPEHLILTTKEEIAAQTAKEYRSTPNPIDFDVDPVTGCFNCTSHAANDEGYHTIVVDGEAYGVHRFVYEQMFGEIPEGLIVRHLCGNPHCCNPEHLALGTDGDNARDRDEHGRTARGTKNGRSKLTEEDVREIKKRLAAGDGVRHLARVYGVTHAVISAINRGLTWNHVS